MAKNRKGQEEIVGFVLVVVLVSIILLVFLGIMVRQKGNDSYRDSKEVSQFLQGASEYTTRCAINFEGSYSKLGEIYRECHNGKQCLSGEKACDVLNDSIKELIESSWQIGNDRPIKGYILNSTYISRNNQSESSDQVMFMQKGNCSSSLTGSEDISPDSLGNIITSLKLCY